MAAPPRGAFLIAPYLQLGKLSGEGNLSVLWAPSSDAGPAYRLQWRPAGKQNWSANVEPEVANIPHFSAPIRLCTARLVGLPKGQSFEYRILDSRKNSIFQSTAHVPAAKDTWNLAVFGDCAWAGAGEKAVAKKVFEDGADLVMITGDIVYHHGTVSEYMSHFFPVYNAEQGSAEGAPLLRSTLMVAAPGNHDLYNGSLGIAGDLHAFPDGLAYFYFWDQPLNGPNLQPEHGITPLQADAKEKALFLAGAGNRFPGMASFSFDYANSHWTVLDSNPYADWTSGKRAEWLEADLKAGQSAKWHFVAFHHPAFHSGHSHGGEQHMRRLAPLFEKYNIDIVFAGHVHNYQRSYPVKFTPSDKHEFRLFGGANLVPGEFRIDTDFDGVKDTTPQGPIYIVSGCGGAPLAAERALENPSHREPFTANYAAVHSYTRCELKGNSLVMRQITGDGAELDRITVTKE